MTVQISLFNDLPGPPVIETGVWLPGEVHRSAVISADGVYRWSLHRQWGHGPTCAWVMLNPSTADGRQDDPTIRRCIRFARDWGYGGITVANLYALRSRDPKALWQHPDPVGPENDQSLTFIAEHAPLIMLAWGTNARADRARHVTNILHRCYEHGGQLATLGWTKVEHGPRHPLYVRADTQPQPWYGEPLIDPAAAKSGRYCLDMDDRMDG